MQWPLQVQQHVSCTAMDSLGAHPNPALEQPLQMDHYAWLPVTMVLVHLEKLVPWTNSTSRFDHPLKILEGGHCAHKA